MPAFEFNTASATAICNLESGMGWVWKKDEAEEDNSNPRRTKPRRIIQTLESAICYFCLCNILVLFGSLNLPFVILLTGHLPLTFRTPPVSPPRPSYLRRVCSLEFRPNLMNTPDTGLVDPLLGSHGASGVSERSFLPQSTIYNWSCGHFSKPLLTAIDDAEEIVATRDKSGKHALDLIAKCQHSSINKWHNPIASWDTKFETSAKTILVQPFFPVVIAADETERIRIWDYEKTTLLNSFDNHDYSGKGISKLCLVNELDDSLLLVASSDGNIRVWKDYTLKGKHKLVTAFSSIQGHRPGVRSVNAVVDWQQQSGNLYASGEISSIMVWDLDKEQLVSSISSSSDCSVSALV